MGRTVLSGDVMAIDRVSDGEAYDVDGGNIGDGDRDRTTFLEENE